MADHSKKIWNYLLKNIGNEFGVAGLMGNLKAESRLESTNAEDSYMKKMGMTDAQYTQGVDDGSYKNFVKDAVGYGLAQWTYNTRKKALLAFAQSKKKSIGDLDMQLAFLIDELKGKYKGVYDVLVKAKSVREASDVVLIHFENPANKNEAVQIYRCGLGQDFYNKYANNTEPAEQPKEEPKQPEIAPVIAKVDKVIVTTEKRLNVRNIPSTVGSRTVHDALPYGTVVTLAKRQKGLNNGKMSEWGYVEQYKGWICLDYTKNC